MGHDLRAERPEPIHHALEPARPGEVDVHEDPPVSLRRYSPQMRHGCDPRVRALLIEREEQPRLDLALRGRPGLLLLLEGLDLRQAALRDLAVRGPGRPSQETQKPDAQDNPRGPHETSREGKNLSSFYVAWRTCVNDVGHRGSGAPTS